jgi:CBS domain containing-hemolysin-like protein
MPEPEPESLHLTAIFFTLLFIALGFVLATVRIALRKTQISQLNELGEIESGRKLERVKHLLEYKKKNGRLFSYLDFSILLNTLFLGWAGAHWFHPLFQKAINSIQINALNGAGDAWIFSVSAALATGITLLALYLVFMEFLPRALTEAAPHRMAYRLYWILKAVDQSLPPLLRQLRALAGFILKPLGLNLSSPQGPTKEDIRLMLEEGSIPEDQTFLIERAFDFGAKTAKHVMIPRPKISYLPLNQPLHENLRIAKKYGFTRFPLVEKDMDSVNGYVNIKDFLWLTGLKKQNFDLRKISREMLFVPESKPISDLLKEFQLKKLHMAMVVDEYGTVAGLVTIEDILEELVGEIQDEYDQEQPKIQMIEPNKFSVDAAILIDELEERFEIRFPDHDDDTLGGFVLTQVGHMPEKNEKIRCEGFHLIAHEISENSITRLLLEITETPNSDKESLDEGLEKPKKQKEAGRLTAVT